MVAFVSLGVVVGAGVGELGSRVIRDRFDGELSLSNFGVLCVLNGLDAVATGRIFLVTLAKRGRLSGSTKLRSDSSSLKLEWFESADSRIFHTKRHPSSPMLYKARSEVTILRMASEWPQMTACSFE